MVSVGPRRPFRHLCPACWTVETRSSNSRLISALNEMTRHIDHEPGAQARRDRVAKGGRRAPARSEAEREAPRWENIGERRDDPGRPRWHP